MIAKNLKTVVSTGGFILGFTLMTLVSQAAPVAPTAFWFTPGFGPETLETNAQTLAFIELGGAWYAPAGATCTSSAGTARGAIGETQPVSAVAALSGLKFTQIAFNIGTGGSKFNLGVTVTNDDIRVVLGTCGGSGALGGSVTVYPLSDGVRVGDFSLAITSGHYGSQSPLFKTLYLDVGGRLTAFRLSDFTGTGTLGSFNGIELYDATGAYDPNLVATIGTSLPAYLPSVSRVLPASGLFSPGFDQNPEPDGQTLTGITTSEGTFTELEGLTCTIISTVTTNYSAINEAYILPHTEALNGLRFTRLVANPTTVDFALGRTIGQNDARIRFVLGETAPSNIFVPDPIRVRPLSNGRLVDRWVLLVRSTDYGAASPLWKTTYSNPKDWRGFLTSFAITDFTNGPPGTLTGVDGFRLECVVVTGTNADPNLFGTYMLPPSGTVIWVK